MTELLRVERWCFLERYRGGAYARYATDTYCHVIECRREFVAFPLVKRPAVRR